jgi:glycosyltransferase involved in cell wall biosynthesis
MRVLHVNTMALQGGAARACHRLHAALLGAGHSSRIVSAERVPGRADLQGWLGPSPAAGLLHRATWALEMHTGLEGLLNVESLLGWRRHARWAEVVNLHNLHGYFFNLFLLPRMERLAPLVWTLHDMWALTGHCAYPADCPRWRRGRCRACPNLAGPPRVYRDEVAATYAARRRVYARISPVLVCPSRWLLAQAQRAPLTAAFRALCIPNGLDLGVFRPVGRAASRAALGLPPHDRVLMFSAHFLDAPRKGGDLMLQALRVLKEQGVGGVRLLFVGGRKAPAADPFPYPAHDLGRLDGEALMAAAYSAADLFVLPTRADNLPNGLVESIACGTPCVSFRVGGVPEVVRHGATGWLARPENAADLARCIRRGLELTEEHRRRVEAVCRFVAEREYGVERMRRRYVDLYEELLAERRTHRCAARS